MIKLKIIKYPQSCLLIQTQESKILVDPGKLKYQERFLDEWSEADIILVTHKHGDHINSEVIKDLNIPIYSTKEVQDSYPDLSIRIVKENDVINLGGINIEVVKAVHGYNPLLKNGGEVLENVGYVIDDGNCRLYITSDTICFRNDYQADVVALPVTGYGLTMTSFEAALFAKDLGARLVLLIHMDNDKYPTDLNSMKINFAKEKINYKVLDIEESLEI